MSALEHTGADPFNRDVAANRGYLYTTNARLSSLLANRRLTEAALASVDLKQKRFVDIGCGDGTYTLELFEQGQPSSVLGIDLAEEAIAVATQRAAGKPIRFLAGSASRLPIESDSYDVAQVRGVLHHMDDPIAAIREALRVAPLAIVIEPNGYNPVLKIIERLSAYHRAHGEKSYAPRTLRKWVKEVGGCVVSQRYAGLVPFFCPDWMARLLKRIEPLFEALPCVNALSCAVCVLVIRRT